MTFRRGFAYLPTIAAIGAVVALGGCATHHQAGATAGSTPVPSAAGGPSSPVSPGGSGTPPGQAGVSTPAGSAAPAGNRSPAGGVAISVRFTAPASCRKAADGPLLFDLAIANSTSTDYRDIAPLVVAERYPGGVGPLHVLAATLERQDPANGAWQEATMPAGADTPTLQHDWPTVTASSGRTTVVHYRLTPWPQVGPGTAHLTFYALRESDHRVLDQATQPVCFS